MVVANGVVLQSGDAKTLTFQDTSTGTTSVTSRSLQISDSNGQNLATINMGVSLTANFAITADVWLSFLLTFVDNGTTYTKTVNYMSSQFYKLAQAGLAQFNNCGCLDDSITCNNIVKARESINAAITFFNIGDSVSCQTALNAADYYITNPTY